VDNLLKLIGDKALRERLSENGLKRFNALFSTEKNATKLIDVIHQTKNR